MDEITRLIRILVFFTAVLVTQVIILSVVLVLGAH